MARAPPNGMAARVIAPAVRPTLAAMPLTLEEAQTVIAGAHEHANQLGVRVAIAIVDEGGYLLALGRMDGAPPLSSQIAEAKAVGAAVWHRDGDALREIQQSRSAFFAQRSEERRVGKECRSR